MTFFVPPTGLRSSGLGMGGTGGISAEGMGDGPDRIDPVDAERGKTGGGTTMGGKALRVVVVLALRGGGLTGCPNVSLLVCMRLEVRDGADEVRTVEGPSITVGSSSRGAVRDDVTD